MHSRTLQRHDVVLDLWVNRQVRAQPDTDSECELAKAEILKCLGQAGALRLLRRG